MDDINTFRIRLFFKAILSMKLERDWRASSHGGIVLLHLKVGTYFFYITYSIEEFIY